MVSKKILGVAIAAALSASAFAGQDYDLASASSYKVAKASVLSASKVTISSPTALQAAAGDYYVVTKTAANGSALDLDVYGTVGIGLAADQKLYVRVDLTNAAFNAAVTAGDLDMTDSTAAAVLDFTDATADANTITTADTVSQGGAQKDKSVVFTVSPKSGKQFETTDQFRFTIPSLLVNASDVGVKVTFYSSIDNAVNANSPLSTVNNKNSLLTFVDGVKATYTANTVTADADTLFKKFVGVNYGVATEVGNVVVALDGTPVDGSDGTAATLGDLIDVAANKSVLTLTGDFSNADYHLNNAAGCGAVTQQITLFVNNDATQTNTNNKTTNKANAEYKVAVGTSGLGLAAGDTTKTFSLCASKQDNGLVLPASDFKAGIAYDKKSTSVWAVPAQASTAIGSVVRNGATIQVPYLSTAAGLNQKLILVNRNSTSVAYSVAFTPEATVTANGKAAATGTLEAGKTTVIKAADLVTLVGGTRTAATVTVVGSKSKIDAATQTVVTDPTSVSFGSNDTVNLTVQ